MHPMEATDSASSLPQGLLIEEVEPEYLIDDFEDVERLCVNCPKFEKCTCKVSWAKYQGLNILSPTALHGS